MSAKVRVFDYRTRKLTTIPAAELAEGMHCVRLLNGEEVWMEQHQLDESGGIGYIHPPFPPVVKRMIQGIHRAVKDVLPRSVDEWEDYFRQEHDCLREILVWLRLAEVFVFLKNKHREATGKRMDGEQARETLNVLVTCSINGQEHVLATITCRTLSKRRVREIIDVYMTRDLTDYFGPVPGAVPGQLAPLHAPLTFGSSLA